MRFRRNSIRENASAQMNDYNSQTVEAAPANRGQAYLTRAISQGQTPGIQYLAFDSTTIVCEYYGGFAEIKRQAATDSVTTLMAYSMSKSITAAAVLGGSTADSVGRSDDSLLGEYAIRLGLDDSATALATDQPSEDWSALPTGSANFYRINSNLILLCLPIRRGNCSTRPSGPPTGEPCL